ncbi:MAG: hypothetical protein ACC642_02735 [Pseudomonadales bacterium]
MLAQTKELTDTASTARIDEVLGAAPVVKPADHQGDELSDMFELTLTGAQVTAIGAAVRAAVSAGQTTTGTRDRGLGGFIEAWSEYAEYLSRRER